MSARERLRRALVGRQVAAAYAVLVGFYLLRHLRFQPLQVPAYLLIVAYDLVEVVLPALTPFYPIGFPAFLYLLAVLGAAVAGRLRSAPTGGIGSAAGGVALIVATLSFLFAALIGGPLVSATDNPTPLAITATAGLTLAIGGLWLLRRPASQEGGPAA